MDKENKEFSTCLICRRKLKSKKARELGMGAICYKRYLENQIHKKLFDTEKKD